MMKSSEKEGYIQGVREKHRSDGQRDSDALDNSIIIPKRNEGLQCLLLGL
jgi:hypothetical protein